MATSMSSSEMDETQILKEIAIQFMEMVPVRRLKWNNQCIDSEQLSPEIQKRVLGATVLSPVCKKFPPSLSYRRAFMKQFLNMLENFDVEIADEVYESYTDLLRMKEEEDDTLCYKTYTLPNEEVVSLQESVHLISLGTTGLSTWQAAQHLAEWSFENQHLFENRKVLELGSGLGLTGIAICKQCQVKSYIFSDCHQQVLYLLAKNVERNVTGCQSHGSAYISKEDEKERKHEKIMKNIRKQLSLSSESWTEALGQDEVYISPVTSPIDMDETHSFVEELNRDLGQFVVNGELWDQGVSSCVATLRADTRLKLAKLDWETEVELLLDQLSGIDIVLGADVVYDKSIIPMLVMVLKVILSGDFGNGHKPVAYISSTIRNEDTRDQFLITLASEGLLYEAVDPPSETVFHYDRSIPIEIMKIYMQ